MFEQKNCRNIQICASVVVGCLALSTISSGLFLIYCDYISATDFALGLGVGFGSSATMASIAGCALKNRFFNQDKIKQKDNENEDAAENNYLLNGIN